MDEVQRPLWATVIPSMVSESDRVYLAGIHARLKERVGASVLLVWQPDALLSQEYMLATVQKGQSVPWRKGSLNEMAVHDTAETIMMVDGVSETVARIAAVVAMLLD